MPENVSENAATKHLATEILIAANPKSGAASSRQRVTDLQAALNNHGLHAEIITSLDELRLRANKSQAAGRLRAVVSAGGDGTVAAVANLISATIPLLIFPLGTENLLAKHLNSTNDIQQACNVILAQRSITMDVGEANGKLFLVMLSCGFDAEVVRQMHSIRTGHINRWSYTRPILTTLRSYRFPQLEFQLDAIGDPAVTAAWLFVFNVPRYAAGLSFCPQADPFDGQLNVCTFRHSGLSRGLHYFGRLWLNSHQRLRDFQHSLCKTLTVPVPLDRNDQPLDIPYQLDGDPGGVLPLQVKVLPNRLCLLTPSDNL